MKTIVVFFAAAALFPITANAGCEDVARDLSDSNAIYACSAGNCNVARNYQKIYIGKKNNLDAKINYKILYNTRQGPETNGVILVNVTTGEKEGEGKVRFDKPPIDFACNNIGKRGIDRNDKFARDGVDYTTYDRFHREGSSSQQEDVRFLRDRLHFKYKRKDGWFERCSDTNVRGVRERFLFEERNKIPTAADVTARRTQAVNEAYANISVNRARRLHVIGYKRANRAYSCVWFDLKASTNWTEVSIDDLNDPVENEDFERPRIDRTILIGKK